SFYELHDPPPPVEPGYAHRDYGEALMRQAWHPPGAVALTGEGPWQIRGLSSDRGAVLNLDLGAQYTGNVVLQCTCPSSGVIDIGWSEYLDADRPRILQKGTSYVDRVQATEGPLQWMHIQFNGGRYLSLWFRGFTGDLTIERVG